MSNFSLSTSSNSENLTETLSNKEIVLTLSKYIKGFSTALGLTAVQRSVTGRWCDLEWNGASVWSAVLSVWLCKVWCNTGWLLQRPASFAEPAASSEWECAALSGNVLPCARCTRKKTHTAARGKSVDTIIPAGGPWRQTEFSHFYINTEVY